MPPLQLICRPLDTNIEMGVPAKGPRPYRSPGSTAEGSIREGGESHRGRAAKEGEGGREEEEAVEIACVGAGGDTDSDDDDDEEDDDEVVANTERDDLESKDMLAGIRSSLQGSGPLPYHEGESTSEGPVEMGRTDGLP